MRETVRRSVSRQTGIDETSGSWYPVGQYNALAEFTAQRPGAASYLPSETDSLFHACFKAPELRFVCDHDVLLHLTVENGHVALDSFKAGGG